MTGTMTPGGVGARRSAVDAATAESSPLAESADLYDPFVRRGKWWLLSTFVALIFAVLLGLIWVTWPGPPKPEYELVNREFYLARVADIGGPSSTFATDPSTQVETGIFVQTLDFVSPSDVHVTGYVWQRFAGDFEAALRDGFTTDTLPMVDLTTQPGEPGRLCSDDADQSGSASGGSGSDEAAADRSTENCFRPGLTFPDMVESGFGMRPFLLDYAPADADGPDDSPGSPTTVPATTEVVTAPVTTAPVTTAPVTTAPVTTAPVTTGAVTSTVPSSASPVTSGAPDGEGTVTPTTALPETRIASSSASTTPAPSVASTDPAASGPTSTAPVTVASTTPANTVPTPSDLDPDVPVSTAAPGTTTVVWYFEGPIRQPLRYDDFPFDSKIITLRMWPSDFLANAILVPDYRGYPCPSDDDQPASGGAGGTGSGYTCTKADDTFGVDERIVLQEFDPPTDTYFDIITTRYTTDLGLQGFDQQNYPDMTYNLVLHRQLLNPFVSNLVPFIVAAGLAFAVLMTVTGRRDRAGLFNFSTTQVMTTLSALFFATLLAHLQLRGAFAGVVYFETFYFVMYLVLLGVAIEAVLVTAEQTRNMKLVRYGDNLIPQLLYWPTLLGTIVAVSLAVRWNLSMLWSWVPWT